MLRNTIRFCIVRSRQLNIFASRSSCTASVFTVTYG